MDTTRVYIYTKYGEEYAAARNLDVRKAGTIARFGYSPLYKSPLMAYDWERDGFVEGVEVSLADYMKIEEAFAGANERNIAVQYPLTPEQIEAGRAKRKEIDKEKERERLAKVAARRKQR